MQYAYQVILGKSVSDRAYKPRQSNHISVSSISYQKWQALTGTLLLAVIFYAFLPDYLPYHPTDILGVLLLPFIAQKGTKSKKWFYLTAAIALWLINRDDLNTLYYASFICTALFWWEYLGFRFNYLPLFLLAVIAPITRRIFYTWSFPIRLEMSNLAAKSLTFIGLPTEVTGNVIYFNETAFSVDPACTGLKMLTIALVFGIFILAWYERQFQKRMNFMSIVAFLLLTLFLAIFANFSRLLALIIFHILPENPMHEMIGLFAVALYVLLPMFWLGKFYVRRFGKDFVEEEKVTKYDKIETQIGQIKLIFADFFGIFNRKSIYDQVNWWKKLAVFTSLGALITIGGIENQRPEWNADEELHALEIPDFEKEILVNGVVKLKKKDALVYLKPPVASIGMPHDPRYCWQGDGWEFKHIREEQINGVSVYAAQLQKEQTTLYTLWWYDNGEHQTIRESEWRWGAMKGGEGYRLVNVTGVEEGNVKKEAENLIINGFGGSIQ